MSWIFICAVRSGGCKGGTSRTGEGGLGVDTSWVAVGRWALGGFGQRQPHRWFTVGDAGTLVCVIGVVGTLGGCMDSLTADWKMTSSFRMMLNCMSPNWVNGRRGMDFLRAWARLAVAHVVFSADDMGQGCYWKNSTVS